MEGIQTLIVCEKPDAAARVARALDEDSDPRRVENKGAPFFEARRGKETIFVCSALGHLYTVDSKTRVTHRFFPVWDCNWKAKSLVDQAATRLVRWIQTISSLAKNADRFVNGCDYDVEGSLIGHTILRYACNGAHLKAERMKFSTMTEKELQAAYRTLAPGLDYSQADAGQCRHELDWLYGINLSRLLTESTVKQNKGYATLSTGRVQGPTLKFVVEREEKIQCFAPTPFWTIEATIVYNGRTYKLEYEKETIATLTDATRVVNDSANVVLDVVAREFPTFQQAAPYPFDLSTLQAEAYRHFGYSPARSLALAERLYLEALISYPRTSSQKLPLDIGYNDILRKIAERPRYRALASKLATRTGLRANHGPGQDPAHPAIYPTGESPKRTLLHQEANLLDLIIKRFMATFAEASLRENTKLTLAKNPHKFFLKGTHLLKEGWIEFYKPYGSDESQLLPDIKIGDQVPIKSIAAIENFTEAPPRFNPSSLLRKMEDASIGTKATRAEIIEILYRRGYIREVRMEATPLALKIVSILDKYCPPITDAAFTAQLESKLERIRTGQTERREVLAAAFEHLRPVMLSLIAKENELGAQLTEEVLAQRLANITLRPPCPLCGSKLMVIRSRASGKRFIGCTGYSKGCRFTLPLPQFGTLTLTPRNCGTCGFQQIQFRSRGRRPLISCPKCYATRMREKCRIKAVENTRRPMKRGRSLEGSSLIKD